MITLSEALDIIKNQNLHAETETVQLGEAYGRVLVDDTIATIDNPPFNKAAMDGWAISSEDQSKTFTIIESISAGSNIIKTIKKGECSKIMTGAPLPHGADFVIRVEYTKSDNKKMEIIQEETNNNVINQGENYSVGDLIINSKIIRAQEIAALASLGIKDVLTYKNPKIGVINSGSEICEPGNALKKGMIFNSNGHSLNAQIKGTGCDSNYYGIIKDDPDILSQEIKKGIEDNDILLISGGVSVGDFDFVPDVLRSLGVEILFHKVAVKPGKPVLFGRKGKTFIFGLPGNPVATFVLFEQLVKPLIYQLQGLEYEQTIMTGVLKQSVKSPKSGRISFKPIKLINDEIHCINYGGSSNISALTDSNGFLKLDPGAGVFEEGTRMNVQLISTLTC